MQHLRAFCIANTISPSFSRRKGATTILSSLHHWNAQQPLYQRLKLDKLPIVIYGLIPWFSFCFWVWFFWYLIFMVENWQNLVLLSLFLAHQCWAYCCVWLVYGMRIHLTCCKTTCRTSFAETSWALCTFCFGLLQRYGVRKSSNPLSILSAYPL